MEVGVQITQEQAERLIEISDHYVDSFNSDGTPNADWTLLGHYLDDSTKMESELFENVDIQIAVKE